MGFSILARNGLCSLMICWLLLPVFSLLSFLRKRVLFHHAFAGSSWFRLGFLSMICMSLLLSSLVPVLVSLLLPSFFPQERGFHHDFSDVEQTSARWKPRCNYCTFKIPLSLGQDCIDAYHKETLDDSARCSNRIKQGFLQNAMMPDSGSPNICCNAALWSLLKGIETQVLKPAASVNDSSPGAHAVRPRAH